MTMLYGTRQSYTRYVSIVYHIFLYLCLEEIVLFLLRDRSFVSAVKFLFQGGNGDRLQYFFFIGLYVLELAVAVLIPCYRSIESCICKTDINAFAICQLWKFTLVVWYVDRLELAFSYYFGGISYSSPCCVIRREYHQWLDGSWMLTFLSSCDLYLQRKKNLCG